MRYEDVGGSPENNFLFEQIFFYWRRPAKRTDILMLSEDPTKSIFGFSKGYVFGVLSVKTRRRAYS